MATGIKRSIKLVIVGDGAVGKTSLLITYTSRAFPEEYVPTVFDNYNAIEVHNGEPINLIMWDTAGQEDYDKLRPLSYPQTDVFVVCFSLVTKDSMHNVKTKWVPEITAHCKGVPFVLVGTKEDLRSTRSPDEYSSSTEEGQAFADSLGAVTYLECSALNNNRVTDVFKEAIKAVMGEKATTSKSTSKSEPKKSLTTKKSWSLFKKKETTSTNQNPPKKVEKGKEKAKEKEVKKDSKKDAKKDVKSDGKKENK